MILAWSLAVFIGVIQGWYLFDIPALAGGILSFFDSLVGHRKMVPEWALITVGLAVACTMIFVLPAMVLSKIYVLLGLSKVELRTVVGLQMFGFVVGWAGMRPGWHLWTRRRSRKR